MEDPVHVECSWEQDWKHNSISSSLQIDNDNHSANKDKFGGVVCAEIEPNPAAVVGNEIDSSLVSEISILCSVIVLISESTDDTISSEGLVHEGVHWSMKSMADSVKLIINAKVWLYDEVEQDDEACKENNDPVA